MTHPSGRFSAYHVALADGLSYRQLFMYIQRYCQSIEETFEKEYMFRNALCIISYYKFSVKNKL